MKRILFLLKERFYSHSKTSYGLINSATHVAAFLESKGNECRVVSVRDSNSIDNKIYSFKPDIVVIEALWVPTYKLEELMDIERYSHIQWVIRVHSDMGFLSCESQGLKLLNEYIALNRSNLTVSLNSFKFINALKGIIDYNFTYLPNIITSEQEDYPQLEQEHHIDIGCFGATRLLKNQCFQAICAMKAADVLGKELRFHVTPNLDQGNDPILANLIELFVNSKHKLVVHDWLPNHEFQELVRRMDLGLQISFTETFNIVTADFISNNRLIITSPAIDWLDPIMHASTIDYDDVVEKIVFVYKNRFNKQLKRMSRNSLKKYNTKAKNRWEEFLHKQHKHHHGKN